MHTTRKIFSLFLATVLGLGVVFVQAPVDVHAAEGAFVYEHISQDDISTTSGWLYARAKASANRQRTVHSVADTYGSDHGNWAGDMQGRMILAAVRQAAILHDDDAIANWVVALMDGCMANLVEGTFMNYAVSTTQPIEQFYSGHSWFLRAMCEVYKYDPDNDRGLGANAFNILVNLVDRMLIGNKEKIQSYPSGWSLSGGDTACYFMMMDGASDAYHVLKDIPGQESRAAALKDVIDIYVSKFDAYDPIAGRYQTHAQLTAVRGLIRFYGDTGETLALACAEKRMVQYIRYAMTEAYSNYNWWQRPEWTEGCGIIDSYEAAMDLFRVTGDVQWLDYSQWFLYTGMGFNQRQNGGFGTDNCIGPGNAAILRQIGEAPQCCTMRGGEGTADAIINSYMIDPAGALLALQYGDSVYKYASPTGDVVIKQTSAYPDATTARFEITDPGASTSVTLKLFVPATATELAVSVDGDAVPVVVSDRFITVQLNPQEDSVVDFTFALPVENRSSRESQGHMAGLVYSQGYSVLGWRTGNTAEANLPFENRTLVPVYKMFNLGGTYEVITARLNHVVGLPATATSGSATAINDGSKATAWTSDAQTSPDSAQSVTIDLGLPSPVDIVVVYPYATGAQMPWEYNIEFSTDGVAFDVFKIVTESDVLSYSRGFEVDIDPAQTARYVRVNATKLAGNGSGNYVAQLGEVEVYMRDKPMRTVSVEADAFTLDHVSINGGAPMRMPAKIAVPKDADVTVEIIPSSDTDPENEFYGIGGYPAGNRTVTLKADTDKTLVANYSPSPLVNLAYQKSVSSSNGYTNSPNWANANLTDGYCIHPNAGNSVGYTSNAYSSADIAPLTITVDLGSDQTFDVIKLFPRDDGYYAADGRYAGFPVDFTIGVRASEASAYTIVGGYQDEPNPAAGVGVYRVGVQTARYIQLTVTKIGPPPSDTPSTFRVQLAELSVYKALAPKDRCRVVLQAPDGYTATINGQTVVMPTTAAFPSGTPVSITTDEPDFQGWHGDYASANRTVNFIIRGDVAFKMLNVEELTASPTVEVKMISLGDLTATATSEMDVAAYPVDANAGNGNASYAIDGRTTTWWNTDYKHGASVGKPPQSITVSLAAPRYVCRYVYFARASGVNGIVTQYLLEGRNGGGEWFTLASGTWPGTTASVSTVDFSPVWLTDVRLTVLAAAGGTNDWPCAAEINLYEWVEEKFEALQVEIPQSVMTASADDEMNAMEHSNDVAAGNGPADFAIDGKTTTWWSTDYYVNAPLPHALTLDLGGVHKVTKVVYYARTTIGNGNIKQYELEGLTPDSQWVPLAAGAWSGALSEVNTVTFTPTLVTAIRLTAITTTKEPQACVTELKVFEELYDAGPIDIQPIAAYNTVTSLDDTTLAVASRIANNTEEIQGVIPALALYDGSGRLVSVSYGGSIEIAPQGEVQVTHGFDTLAPNVRCDAKLFFFSADDYTPLTDDFTFKL